MSIFEVDLFEGKELVTYEVEAVDENEAKQKALAARERFFQEEHTQEGLEREKADLEAKEETRIGRVAAGILRFDESVKLVGRGATDSLLNMGEGIASLYGFQGKMLVDRFKSLRQANTDQAVEYATLVNSRVANRPLTEAEKARTVEDTAKFIKRGKFATDITVGIGTGVATLAAKTVPGMLALGTAEGGLGGYLMADTSDSLTVDEGVTKRIGEATLGAVLGSALSVAPAFFVGAKNWVGRRIARAAGGQESLAASRESLGRLGIYEATPGQLTGDPRLLLAESQAAGQEAQRMFAGQMDAAVQGLGRKVGIELPQTSKLLDGSASAIDDTMDLTKKTLGKMRGARNRAFEEGMEELAELTGNAPVIPVGTMLDDTMRVVREMGEEFGSSIKGGSLFNDTIQDIIAASKTGGLTARKANAILTRLTGMQKTGRGMFDMGQDSIVGQEGKFIGYTQRRAKDLKDALMRSFDDAVEGMPTEAGDKLSTARTSYGAASKDIDAFEDAWKTSVGMGGDPAAILKKLETADPTRARAFVEGLRQMDGGQQSIDRMNEFVFREAARKASKAKASAGLREGDFNIATFVDELSSSAQASRLKGLILPEQEKALAAGLRNLRLLLNSPQFKQGVMPTQLPVDMQHIAINALSRDPGFMARMLAGALQRGSGVESLFFTKAGQDVLFNATQFSLRAPKTATAIQSANATVAYLASLMGAGEQLTQLGESMQPDEQ